MRVVAVALAALISSAAVAIELPETYRGAVMPEETATSGLEWIMVGKAEAIDGDSIRFNGVNMRLLDIDAPELDQVCYLPGGIPWGCGVAAKVRLEQLIGGKPIRCWGHGTDRYGRNLVACGSLDGQTLIGYDMIRAGMAVAFRPAKSPAAYKFEQEARDAKRGMWSGKFLTPAEFRKAKRQHERPS